MNDEYKKELIDVIKLFINGDYYKLKEDKLKTWNRISEVFTYYLVPAIEPDKNKGYMRYTINPMYSDNDLTNEEKEEINFIVQHINQTIVEVTDRKLMERK